MRRKKLRTHRLQEMSMDKLIKKAIKSNTFPNVAKMVVKEYDIPYYVDLGYFDDPVIYFKDAWEIVEKFPNEAVEAYNILNFGRMDNIETVNDIMSRLANALITVVGMELVEYIIEFGDDY